MNDQPAVTFRRQHNSSLAVVVDGVERPERVHQGAGKQSLYTVTINGCELFDTTLRGLGDRISDRLTKGA